jgi:hypothetical protein
LTKLVLCGLIYCTNIWSILYQAFSLEKIAMLGLILIILLVVLLIALIPAWPYSSGWGYYPSGLLAVLLVVVIVLLLVGVLRF